MLVELEMLEILVFTMRRLHHFNSGGREGSRDGGGDVLLMVIWV